MAIHALVVEDDQLIINDVEERLDSLGHTYECVGTQQEARERLDSDSTTYSYILLDLGLPQTFGRSPRVENGLILLKEITETRKIEGSPPVIVMTAHGHDGPDLAVEMLRYGRAIDFIKKPFDSNPEPFETKVTRALERAGVNGEPRVRSTTRRTAGRQVPIDLGSRLAWEPLAAPGLRWEDIALVVKDGHTVSLRVGGETRIYSYVDMGLHDKRNGNPSKQWELLLSFAKGRGMLDWSSPGADRKNQKRREYLAADLKACFGLEEDPFLLGGKGKGWKTRFSISRE